MPYSPRAPRRAVADIADAIAATPNTRDRMRGRGLKRQHSLDDIDCRPTSQRGRSEMRRDQAKLALDRLQSRQENDTPKKIEEIIDDNLKILSDATLPIDGPSMHQRERSQPGARSRSRSVSQVVARRRLLEQSSSGQSQTGTQTQPKENDERAKKKLRKDFVVTRNANDIIYRKPRPIQIQYEHHLPDDRNDNWYVGMFEKLFDDTLSFVTKFFLVHDLTQKDYFQPWSSKLSLEFLYWAREVAEEDPMNGGWDDILRNTAQRKYFIVGILVKIFHTKVFDVMLWGADEEQEKLLMGIERAFFAREGFARTAIRSETVRSMIGRGPVTQFFYREVASLTAQIFLLLKPLTDYLYASTPEDVEVPRVDDQYQALHDLVSNAAYLAICVRMSPTIFFWVNVMPGTYYDRNDHTFLDIDSYRLSKVSVLKDYESRVAAYNDIKKAKEAELKDLEEQGKKDSKAWKKVQDSLEKIKAEAPKDPDREYRAMAKISTWPSIKRFKPGSKADEVRERTTPWLKTPLNMKNGCREFEVSKGAIVCYYGMMDKRKDIERKALVQFVREKERVYPLDEEDVFNFSTNNEVLALAALGVASSGCWILRERIREMTGVDLSAALGYVGELVGRV